MSRPAGRVAAFGELLLRLDAPGHTRLVQTERFAARYTGAEANVAVALSGLGADCSVISKVPESELGQAAIDAVRRFGVRTDHVARGGERLGLLYLEKGAPPRPTKVIYDRANSSFASSTPADYDWPSILDGADWLHFSGTAPAGGTAVAAALLEGVTLARARAVRVSCDLNYRSKLWGAEEAARALARLMPFVDVLTGAGEDAARLFGVRLDPGVLGESGLSLAGHELVARALCERFGLGAVAAVLRSGTSGSRRLLGALSGPDRPLVVHELAAPAELDRIGAGDAFTAGVVYGMSSGWHDERTVALATALYCLAQTIEGDFAVVSLAEAELVAGGGGGGRVER